MVNVKQILELNTLTERAEAQITAELVKEAKNSLKTVEF